MNALFVAFLVIVTSIACVALGIFSAYYTVTGLLTAMNPSRTERGPALVAHESPASGD